MKIAYFDCFSGISGDMAVGALLDAGVPLDVVEDGLLRLGLTRDQLVASTRSMMRSQIHATKFDLLRPDGSTVDGAVDKEQEDHTPEDRTNEDHNHEHHAHVDQSQGAWRPYQERQEEHSIADLSLEPKQIGRNRTYAHQHRSYSTIIEMIDRSDLSAQVQENAKAIFRAIAIAEARIHNMDVANVHFHEVGALDSIGDIVSTAVCLEHLGIDALFSSVVPLGSGGIIQTQHGAMPLPAPATLEILKGYPITLTNIPYELTTPTGAGILKALSRGTLASEKIEVARIGFGAGTRELPDRPNLLRVVIGELVGEDEHDTITLIESNIDDMNPQVYPFLIERLLESGALDVYVTPVIMKKGRPGMLLSLLAPQGAIDELTKVIYRETTTIGVRYQQMLRRKLPREEVLIPSEYGPIRMKRHVISGEVRIVPEYDEARRIARERSIPLQVVLRKLGDVARSAANHGVVDQ